MWLQCFGPITQYELLQQLGMEERVNQLLLHCESEEEADKLIAAATRLVHPEQMGSIYKAMAIVPDSTADEKDGEEGASTKRTQIVPTAFEATE